VNCRNAGDIRTCGCGRFVKAENLGSLLSVFILSFTVVAVLATGILSAYGFVIGILYSFARQARQRTEPPMLAGNRARAAHAGGD
jgi:hypothetical protein